MEERKEYQGFCAEIQAAVRERLSDSIQTEMHKVIKNNGVMLDSLLIIDREQGWSPNFYLQLYYEEYCKGKTTGELAEQICRLYAQAMQQKRDREIDTSFAACKERIIFRIISYSQNESMLQTTPYIRFLDMAVVFYLLVTNEEDGIGSIRITRKWVEEWELTVSAVFALARENTRRLFPERICSMHSVLTQLIENEEEKVIQEVHTEELSTMEGEPYVITNSNGIHGASAILYPDTLKIVGGIFGEDFYLLPSSIHEFLAIPKRAVGNVSELREMVQEVNDSFVAKEEVLSASVYFYECLTEKLRIC